MPARRRTTAQDSQFEVDDSTSGPIAATHLNYKNRATWWDIGDGQTIGPLT
jgi:hypothetical protein